MVIKLSHCPKDIRQLGLPAKNGTEVQGSLQRWVLYNVKSLGIWKNVEKVENLWNLMIFHKFSTFSTFFQIPKHAILILSQRFLI